MVVIIKIKCSECSSDQLTKCGKNSWRTINKGKDNEKRIKVQRWVCKDCGKYNFSQMTGEPLDESTNNNGGSN